MFSNISKWLKQSTQQLAGKVAQRAMKIAGIPLRDPALIQLFGVGTSTNSGVYVDEYNAANVSAYYRTHHENTKGSRRECKPYA